MLLARFRWWRKWRGGRWARVTGRMYGRRWVKVNPECVERVERVEEDYERGD
jgi:hypothetical protein